MAGKLDSMVREVDAFLMGESKVHETLTRIAKHLEELGIEFALAGGSCRRSPRASQTDGGR